MKWEVIQGDAIREMAKLPSGSIDACVTDPPYNVGLDYGVGVNDARPDYKEWCAAWFKEARRAARSVAFTPGFGNVAMWCAIEAPKWILAWHKPAAMGNSPFGVCNWEPILFYGKARHNSGVDVIRAPIIPNLDSDSHPCPKPVMWAVGLVRLMAGEGGTVLDPFLGSGTTGVACAIEGRNFIGIEQDAHYCEVARARIQRAQGVGVDIPKRVKEYAPCPLFEAVA